MSDDAKTIEWIKVRQYLGGRNDKDIGMIGIADNKVVAIISVYNFRDANKDGKVSWAEWFTSKLMFSMRRKAVAEVAMAALHNETIKEKAPSFNPVVYLQACAAGLIADGIFNAYMARGISGLAKDLGMAIAARQIKHSDDVAWAVATGYQQLVNMYFKNKYMNAAHGGN